MTTTPYAPEADQHVRQHVVVVATAQAHHSSWDEPIPLDVEDVVVTFDEGWAPHVQAQLTCRVPEAQETLDALDPRRGVRVRVDAGYRYPDGREDVHLLCDLLLGDRTVIREASGSGNRLELSAHSDELLVQGWRPLGASRVYPAGQPVGAVIADLIEWAVPDADVRVGLDESYKLLDDLVVGGVDQPWPVIIDEADHAYGWVYHDGAGTWHVVDRPRLASRSRHVLKVGPNGTITGSRTSLSREAGYANAVVIRYANGVLGWAHVADGPFAPVNGAPMVVLELNREPRAVTVDSAMSAAAAVLRRAVSRGRGFDLDAVAALWLRPGHTIAAQLPTGPQERHLVSRVTFRLTDGAMNVTTRVPDNVQITTGG